MFSFLSNHRIQGRTGPLITGLSTTGFNVISFLALQKEGMNKRTNDTHHKERTVDDLEVVALVHNDRSFREIDERHELKQRLTPLVDDVAEPAGSSANASFRFLFVFFSLLIAFPLRGRNRGVVYDRWMLQFRREAVIHFFFRCFHQPF